MCAPGPAAGGSGKVCLCGAVWGVPGLAVPRRRAKVLHGGSKAGGWGGAGVRLGVGSSVVRGAGKILLALGVFLRCIEFPSYKSHPVMGSGEGLAPFRWLVQPAHVAARPLLTSLDALSFASTATGESGNRSKVAKLPSYGAVTAAVALQLLQDRIHRGLCEVAGPARRCLTCHDSICQWLRRRGHRNFCPDLAEGTHLERKSSHHHPGKCISACHPRLLLLKGFVIRVCSRSSVCAVREIKALFLIPTRF